MKPELSFVHPENPGLELGYSLVKADNSQDPPPFGIVPGFAHTHEHFLALAEELAKKGISSACLDFRFSHQRNFSPRNLIGLNAYRSGLGHLVSKIQQDTHQTLAGVIGHSQGGLLIQEWLQDQQQEGLDKNFLTILLAPIPFRGVRDAAVKLARHQPVFFWNIVRSFCTQKGMCGLTDAQIRQLFFDATSKDQTVSGAKSHLTNAPLRVFVEDILRQWVRPTIRPTNRPTLRVTSETDALFPPEQYEDFHLTYTNLQSVTIHGGHDFFIEHAQELAQHIAKFVRANS